MNFELDDDQIALRDGLRRLLEGRFGSDRVRRGFDRSMHQDLADAGVFSLRADGFGWADATIVFEELGGAFVPGPLVPTFLAHGLVTGIVGAVDRDAESPLVEHLDTLDALVVVDGDQLLRVTPGACEATRVERPLDPLTPVWRIAAFPGGDPLGDSHEWRGGRALLTAALAVGLARRATELAVAHALDREQFGRRIGSFQAVKHLCADMACRTELARVAVHAAAVRVDDPTAGDAVRATAGARLLAGEAAIANGRAAMQVLGGMGFTWAVDVHLLLKRAWVLDAGPAAVDACADHLAELLPHS